MFNAEGYIRDAIVLIAACALFTLARGLKYLFFECRGLQTQFTRGKAEFAACQKKNNALRNVFACLGR